MAGDGDIANTSTRITNSLSLRRHSLSTKSMSILSGSFRSLSYQYRTGSECHIEVVSNAGADWKKSAPRNYFFRLLKLNAPEWPYIIMGIVVSILSRIILPTFAIIMSNLIKVFYSSNYATMERRTKEYAFIFIGTGTYSVIAYLIHHYFFNIMGEALTTRIRRRMLAAILRN
ncbi:ABC transporter B family member 19 [Heracleum sosnowskyi]|uniref:ABC transporter B family member 19 n=1 Tax=Heracleum sosnowskyi TaxID=360622 RepID=A0AAD8J7M0_9APIA|nr:ABC transporter B family member 19 [Heracleum sosnowskyi]